MIHNHSTTPQRPTVAAKRRRLPLLAAACLLALPATAGASNRVGNCHGATVQSLKAQAGTRSGEGTADSFGVTLKVGQELISQSCGQS
jgi:hypothetical protein